MVISYIASLKNFPSVSNVNSLLVGFVLPLCLKYSMEQTAIKLLERVSSAASSVSSLVSHVSLLTIDLLTLDITSVHQKSV